METGIDFLLNPTLTLLSQLPISNDSKNMNQREFWLRMCLLDVGALDGEGVLRNTISVRGILYGLHIWVEL